MHARDPSSSDSFDLAVVGAGPAGAACALAAARRGLAVVVFEPCASAAAPPCGEFLLPEGIDALGALGLHELVERGLCIGSVRYVCAGSAPVELVLERPGLSIQRGALQEALQRALELQRRVTRVWDRAETEALPNGFRVGTSPGSRYARVLAVADGASGAAAAWLRPRARGGVPAGTLAVRARYELIGRLDCVEVHLGRTSELVLTPLPCGLVNAACWYRVGGDDVPARAELAMREALALHPAAGERLGAPACPPAARLVAERPAARAAAAGAFLLGDAAAPAPWLYAGVTVALRTGLFAAEAARALVDGAAAGAPERDYHRAVRRELACHRGSGRSLLRLSGLGASVLRRVPSLLGIRGADAGRPARGTPWYAR